MSVLLEENGIGPATDRRVKHPAPYTEYLIQKDNRGGFEVLVTGGKHFANHMTAPVYTSRTYGACEAWLGWEITDEDYAVAQVVSQRSSTNHVIIPTNVLAVLSAGRCEGNNFYFAPDQLERPLYNATKKILELMKGKWTTKVQAFVFPDEAADVIDGALESGEVLDWRKMRQFFATPRAIVEKLIDMAEIGPMDVVLEPSAGRGAIVDVIRQRYPDCFINTCEIDEENCQILKDAGYFVDGIDFMDWTRPVDRIVANPPFSKNQDIRHIRHMWDVLNPGGVLVSVAAASATFRMDQETIAFRNFVAEHGGTIEMLPDNAFRESGTSVKTCVVKMKKSSE